MKLDAEYLFIKISKSRIRLERKTSRYKIGRAKLSYLKLEGERKERNKKKWKEKELGGEGDIYVKSFPTSGGRDEEEKFRDRERE